MCAACAFQATHRRWLCQGLRAAQSTWGSKAWVIADRGAWGCGLWGREHANAQVTRSSSWCRSRSWIKHLRNKVKKQLANAQRKGRSTTLTERDVLGENVEERCKLGIEGVACETGMPRAVRAGDMRGVGRGWEVRSCKNKRVGRRSELCTVIVYGRECRPSLSLS